MNARTETELLEAAAALAAQPTHTHHLSNARLCVAVDVVSTMSSFSRVSGCASGGNPFLLYRDSRMGTVDSFKAAPARWRPALADLAIRNESSRLRRCLYSMSRTSRRAIRGSTR